MSQIPDDPPHIPLWSLAFSLRSAPVAFSCGADHQSGYPRTVNHLPLLFTPFVRAVGADNLFLYSDATWAHQSPLGVWRLCDESGAYGSMRALMTLSNFPQPQ